MKNNDILINFNNNIFNNFDGAILLSYFDSFEENSIVHLGAYRQSIREIITFFKLNSLYNLNMPLDIIAIDCLENEFRFTIIYSIQSIFNNVHIYLYTKTLDGFALLSCADIFSALNWAEREVWDLFGIFFIKHSDLRRILTDYGFLGHALRKDFPLSGFREILYFDSIKSIIYNEIELTQNFRVFNVFPNWISLENNTINA